MLAAIGIVIGVVAIASMGMLGTNMQLEVKDQPLHPAQIPSSYHQILSGWVRSGRDHPHLHLQE